MHMYMGVVPGSTWWAIIHKIWTKLLEIFPLPLVQFYILIVTCTHFYTRPQWSEDRRAGDARLLRQSLSKRTLYRTRKCHNIWIWGKYSLDLSVTRPGRSSNKSLISDAIMSSWRFFPLPYQVDRVYLSAPNAIAILDHEKKRTYVIRKDGLPDIGKSFNTL